MRTSQPPVAPLQPVLAPPSEPKGGRPLRILDITKFYGEASGGVRTYLDAKISDFAERDISHALVIPAERSSLTRVGNTRIYRVSGPVIPFAPNYRLLLSLPAIEKIIEEESPDLIEVGSPFLVPFLTLKAIERRPIPVVGFYHSDLIRTYAEPYVRSRTMAPIRVISRNLARAYIPWVYRRFDATIAASVTVADELRELGVPRVSTIPLGVDQEIFTPHGPATDFRESLGISSTTPIAIHIGRFCPEKRLEVLLKAHAILPEKERPHLVLVGGGQLHASFVEESRRRSGLSVLPYERDRRVVAALLRGADYYLAPGPGETFGLAIAEAVACGLPVVAVDMGAARDRVASPPLGRLYRHGDVGSCATALCEMGASLSTSLAREAREFAKGVCGWRMTFDALLALYTSLLPVRR